MTIVRMCVLAICVLAMLSCNVTKSNNSAAFLLFETKQIWDILHMQQRLNLLSLLLT